ncbi:hypothetical protein GCM10007304_18200 [Rhodococcoides trifolii]|uniref:Uncharacterized protein n=1 Tax=Rhodococcoides trifolii TaxID=908250 RepID=A0A917D0W4_9NOCA|nr:hypothetical protein [Rhodococcus trifolii]GGG04451.1 hypothetical protein GCM10007304_18200 [Rhodococcus trifolii]
MNTVNDALFVRTLNYVTDHPDQLDMSWWRTEDARCFGGWASYLAGGRFISSNDNTDTIIINGHSHFRASVVRTPAGELMHVEDYAIRELGIDEETADALFSDDNTIEDLTRMVSFLIDYGVTYDPTPAGPPVDPSADGPPRDYPVGESPGFKGLASSVVMLATLAALSLSAWGSYLLGGA